MSEPSKPTGPNLAQGIPLDDLADGDMIGGFRLRRLSGDVPPGRGYLVRRRQQRLFQTATFQREGATLGEGLRERVARLTG